MKTRIKISPIEAGGAATCGGLVLLFLLVVVVPLLSHRRDIRDAQATLAHQKAKAASLTSQLNVDKIDLQKTRHAIETSPLALQSDDQLDQRLMDVSNFGKSCGLEIEDLTPGAPLSYPQYQTIPIHVSARGSYRSCLKFMHELHAHCLDVGIKSFRLSGVNTDETDALGAQFDLVWHAKPATAVVSTQ
jgi:Tfp pilus assembly protein PilO